MTRNQIEYWRLRETERSNKANEDLRQQQINNDYDLGLKQYNLGLGNLQLGWAQLNERIRSNKANEWQARINSDRNWQINLLNHTETVRRNKAQEKIAYAQLDEQKRYNKVLEYQQNQRIANERQNLQLTQRSIIESERTHKANEYLQLNNLLEQQRANRQQESLSLMRLNEQNRSNLAQEGISRFRNQLTLMSVNETRRSNLAREAETNRSNRVNETLRLTEIATRTTTELIKAQKLGGKTNGKTNQNSGSGLTILEQIDKQLEGRPYYYDQFGEPLAQ